MKFLLRKNLVMLSSCVLLSASSAQAAVFDISLNFTDNALTTEQQGVFTVAANFWKSIITGYSFTTPQNFHALDNGITIDISGYAGSVGGTLASGGPTFFPALPQTGGYSVAIGGSIEIDTLDIPNLITNDTFLSVIKHEMAHVLGFGTLWTANGKYTEGSGQYTGAYGLAAYKSEFNQASATFVPVELEGGAGTANGHWNENNNGSGNTGIQTAQGQDMRFELMTGWLNTPASSLFLSNTTIQSFRDLGYTVAAVPLPASVWFFGTALFSFMGVSAKKRRS